MAANQRVSDLRHMHVLGKFGYLYTIHELEAVLRHYGVETVSPPLKGQLLQQLARLEVSQNVTARDRRRIINDIRYHPSRPTRQPNLPPVINRVGPAVEYPLREAQRQKLLETREHPAKKSEGAIQDCCICCEEFVAEDFPNSVTPGCAHNEEANICFACCAQSIEAQLEAGQWSNMLCPICPTSLSFHDIKRLATPEIFERYDHFFTNQALEMDPKFHNCLNSSCSSGQFHDEPARCTMMKCHSCNFVTCTNHHLPWHSNQTCEEYDANQARRRKQLRQEAATEAFLASPAVTRCPGQNCGIPLQKNQGCDHFTCSQCFHEFCWLCSAAYSQISRKGLSAHKPSCRYYASAARPRARHRPRWI